jgi:hypothetical protein
MFEHARARNPTEWQTGNQDTVSKQHYRGGNISHGTEENRADLRVVPLKTKVTLFTPSSFAKLDKAKQQQPEHSQDVNISETSEDPVCRPSESAACLSGPRQRTTSSPEGTRSDMMIEQAGPRDANDKTHHGDDPSSTTPLFDMLINCDYSNPCEATRHDSRWSRRQHCDIAGIARRYAGVRSQMNEARRLVLDEDRVLPWSRSD